MSLWHTDVCSQIISRIAPRTYSGHQLEPEHSTDVYVNVTYMSDNIKTAEHDNTPFYVSERRWEHLTCTLSTHQPLLTQHITSCTLARVTQREHRQL